MACETIFSHAISQKSFNQPYGLTKFLQKEYKIIPYGYHTVRDYFNHTLLLFINLYLKRTLF